MARKVAIISLLLVSGLISVGCSTPSGNNDNPNGLIFFYGDACPHCKIVEQYLGDNKIEDVLTIDKREVYNNRDNASLMAKKADACGINPKELGVPLLVDGDKCFLGDKDSIEHLKSKLNQ